MSANFPALSYLRRIEHYKLIEIFEISSRRMSGNNFTLGIDDLNTASNHALEYEYSAGKESGLCKYFVSGINDLINNGFKLNRYVSSEVNLLLVVIRITKYR